MVDRLFVAERLLEMKAVSRGVSDDRCSGATTHAGAKTHEQDQAGYIRRLGLVGG